MNVKFSTNAIQQTEADALVITVLKNNVQAVESVLGDNWSQVLELEKFTGKPDDKLCLPAMGSTKTKWIIFVGSGDGSIYNLRRAAGAAGSLTRKKGMTSAAF